MKRTSFLLLVIFLEGYVVLSTELLAIRQTIPYIGNATDTVSIIIAAVLMPLAFGYHSGGRFVAQRAPGLPTQTIRKKLLRNLALSAIILTVGLSYFCISLFFQSLNGLGIPGRIIPISLYALIFIVYPVFLLGQTVPLISNFFPKEKHAALTGRILFISTLGSFVGAVFCTLVLMSWLGVHHAATATILCLALLVLMLAKKKMSDPVVAVACCVILSLGANSDFLLRTLGFVHNNQYHTVRIVELDEESRVMMLNNNYSALYSENPDRLVPYIKHLENNLLKPIRSGPKKSILMIGAGGFIPGMHDTKNEYIFLDINPALKKVVEEKLHKKKLGANKTFIPTPARAYLAQTDKKFDLIYIDVYYGYSSVPEHLVTQEFFQQVKDAIKDDGIVGMNFIISPNFNTAFAVNIDATFRSVFPHTNREAIGFYNGWERDPSKLLNVIYTAYNPGATKPGSIYTDDLNRSYLDGRKKVQ